MSELARTFLRTSDGQLHVGIYYSRWLIEQLERHDPRAGLNDANIRSLVAFVEEINHALHAALSFQRGVRAIGGEDYARNLELQAQVDTYLVLLLFVAFFRKAQRVSRTDRRWLRFHLFARHDPARVQRPEPARTLPRNDPAGPRLTPAISTRSTACDGWRKSAPSTRSITRRRNSASSPCPPRARKKAAGEAPAE